MIATAATNDRYSVDGTDLPEFYFDDQSIAKLEKRLNPTIAAAPTAEPTPAAPVRSRAKDCATLTKIMASKDEIAAKHGAQKAAEVMVAARKRFEEYRCAGTP